MGLFFLFISSASWKGLEPSNPKMGLQPTQKLQKSLEWSK